MRVVAPVSQDATQAATAAEPFVPQVYQWVQLRDRPSPYGFDQALLLCETTEGRWVAWVPEHGETELDRDQFFKVQ